MNLKMKTPNCCCMAKGGHFTRIMQNSKYTRYEAEKRGRGRKRVENAACMLGGTLAPTLPLPGRNKGHLQNKVARASEILWRANPTHLTPLNNTIIKRSCGPSRNGVLVSGRAKSSVRSLRMYFSHRLTSMLKDDLTFAIGSVITGVAYITCAYSSNRLDRKS